MLLVPHPDPLFTKRPTLYPAALTVALKYFRLLFQRFALDQWGAALPRGCESVVPSLVADLC